jgi:hypothetical protein
MASAADLAFFCISWCYLRRPTRWPVSSSSCAGQRIRAHDLRTRHGSSAVEPDRCAGQGGRPGARTALRPGGPDPLVTRPAARSAARVTKISPPRKCRDGGRTRLHATSCLIIFDYSVLSFSNRLSLAGYQRGSLSRCEEPPARNGLARSR